MVKINLFQKLSHFRLSLFWDLHFLYCKHSRGSGKIRDRLLFFLQNLKMIQSFFAIVLFINPNNKKVIKAI